MSLSMVKILVENAPLEECTVHEALASNLFVVNQSNKESHSATWGRHASKVIFLHPEFASFINITYSERHGQLISGVLPVLDPSSGSVGKEVRRNQCQTLLSRANTISRWPRYSNDWLGQTGDELHSVTCTAQANHCAVESAIPDWKIWPSLYSRSLKVPLPNGHITVSKVDEKRFRPFNQVHAFWRPWRDEKFRSWISDRASVFENPGKSPVYTCDSQCDFLCDFAYKTRLTLPRTGFSWCHSVFRQVSIRVSQLMS